MHSMTTAQTPRSATRPRPKRRRRSAAWTPTAAPARSRSPLDDKLRHDLKTLAVFTETYCHAQHKDRDKAPLRLKHYDVDAIVKQPPQLCASCRKLLAHAFVKRSNCPMQPKPACRDCPEHCYHPTYRTKIKKVMRFSGMRMLLRGRLDYLWHMRP